MKITTERDVLLRPLQAVLNVTQSRSNLPILTTTLFEIGEGRLNMTCSDMSLQVRASVPMQDAQAQSFTSPTHKLHALLSKLADSEPVTLDPNGARLKVASGGSRYTLSTLPAQEFPKMQSAWDSAVEARMPARDLKQALGLVMPAMADRDIRYYLNGLKVELTPGVLTLAATDGHRLAMTACAVDCHEDAHVILANKTCTELEKLLPADDSSVFMRFDSKHAQFSFGSVEMTTSLVEGNYPDWRKVLPSEDAQPISFDRARLQAALQRAITLTDKFPGGRFTLAEGALRIDVKNLARDEATEELSGIDYHGAPIEAGFNVEYVLQALPSFAEKVELSFVQRAPHVTLLIMLPGREDWKHLIMSANV